MLDNWVEREHKIFQSLATKMNMIYNHPKVEINETQYTNEIKTQCTQECHKTELFLEFVFVFQVRW